MIIVTGAAGFIGSCVVSTLLAAKLGPVVGVDDFSIESKFENFKSKELQETIDRTALFDYVDTNSKDISMIIHMGARTDTVDQDPIIFKELNIDYSIKLWEQCCQYNIPIIYASSAATYGNGAFGFDDQMEDVSPLTPLNEYGRSKQIFDEWVLEQTTTPPYWVGLKFFNVYGPNEYHKSRMASVIFHAFHQIKSTGKMKLFGSHNEHYKDGEQLRDFIYVKDVCETILALMSKHITSGIYNLGTGKARTFLDLVNGVFSALDLPSNIEFIDIPEDIRENYQYFTEAKMDKLSEEGISTSFHKLEEGIDDYVKNYLVPNQYL